MLHGKWEIKADQYWQWSNKLILAYKASCSLFMETRRKTFLFFSFFFLLLFSVCLLQYSFGDKTPCLEISIRLTVKIDFHFAELGNKTETKNVGEIKTGVSLSSGSTRRLLSGPGSFPPRCASKCGRCTPCKPVHVPVPPGTPVIAEYYPEAWRCKCGNKLYMP